MFPTAAGLASSASGLAAVGRFLLSFICTAYSTLLFSFWIGQTLWIGEGCILTSTSRIWISMPQSQWGICSLDIFGFYQWSSTFQNTVYLLFSGLPLPSISLAFTEGGNLCSRFLYTTRICSEFFSRRQVIALKRSDQQTQCRGPSKLVGCFNEFDWRVFRRTSGYCWLHYVIKISPFSVKLQCERVINYMLSVLTHGHRVSIWPMLAFRPSIGFTQLISTLVKPS